MVPSASTVKHALADDTYISLFVPRHSGRGAVICSLYYISRLYISTCVKKLTVVTVKKKYNGQKPPYTKWHLASMQLAS